MNRYIGNLLKELLEVGALLAYLGNLPRGKLEVGALLAMLRVCDFPDQALGM